MSKTETAFESALEQLERMVHLATTAPEVLSTSVSAWSSGMHLQHLLMVNTYILKAIRHCLAGKADSLTKPAGMIARMVLESGRIPRGRVKAPEIAIPLPEHLATLAANLEAQRRDLENLRPQLADIETCVAMVPHPSLGGLTASEWLRFLQIHNAHHLEIISDILLHASR